MGRNNRISGIYMIKNKIDNKLYIGQSKDVKCRWINHKSRLNCNNHPNNKLQNAWNKYGEENFDFILLEECNQDIIDEREIYWISYYNSANRDYGYNLSTGGECSCEGVKLTQEQKDKMSQVKNPDSIVQLDFDGNLINRWRSASYASRVINVRCSSIIKCIKHDGIYQVGGYIWLYESEYEEQEFNIIQYKLLHPKSFNLKIKQIDLYGNVVHIWDGFNNIKDNLENFQTAMIGECCNHNRKTYKGYIWLYEIDDFILTDDYLLECRINTGLYKVEQYDIKGCFLRKWTIEQLKENQYNISTIRQNCTGKTKTAYNYIWKYEGDNNRIIDSKYCQLATKRQSHENSIYNKNNRRAS